jgi:alpha-L-fucosidase
MLLAAMLTLAQTPIAPLPTPQQIAWQAMELNAFVHFGPNTFTDVEWGDGRESPEDFQPTDLDCEQWVTTFKQAGFKGVILTAKHHDGFALWPSKYSNHTVARSSWRGGRGDLLKDLSEACRKHGLKFGLYVSPWDRNHPTYGTPEYNDVFVKMLEEVLTAYGPIFEVWFDGANGEGPNGKRQEYDWPRFIQTVRLHQPDAVIFSDAGPDVRWVGNEAGIAPERCWSMIPSGRYVPGTPHYKELGEGREDGDLWVPAEADVSIRPGWFYHAAEDAKVKTPEQLVDLYEKSVGRNSLLLLNVPPDKRGRIAEPDVRSLLSFGATIRRTYGEALAAGAYELASGSFTAEFPSPVTFDRVSISEDIATGQRVKAFKVEVRSGGNWMEVARGSTIGHRRILPVEKVNAGAVRVTVLEARAPVARLNMSLHLLHR